MTNPPRWLELEAEIGYRLFLLGAIQKELQEPDGRSTLDIMIDQATGYVDPTFKQLEKDAYEIIAEIEALKAELETM